MAGTGNPDTQAGRLQLSNSGLDQAMSQDLLVDILLFTQRDRHQVYPVLTEDLDDPHFR